MLALALPIKTRLQSLPQLTGWDVRSNMDETDRGVLPAADFRCVGAVPGVKKGGASMVSPVWRITLALRRGPSAPVQLDTAMTAVICALLGWQPGECGGRGWEPLVLERVSEPDLVDEGLAAYELDFSTSALYMGQQ